MRLLFNYKNMNYNNIKEKIDILKYWRTASQIKKELSLQWLEVSKSFIYKYTKWSNYKYKVVCKKCWNTFFYKYPRKYCKKCSWYYSTKSKKELEREKTKKQRREIKEMLKETKRITWLSEKRILNLLLANTHTEIRKYFNLNNWIMLKKVLDLFKEQQNIDKNIKKLVDKIRKTKTMIEIEKHKTRINTCDNFIYDLKTKILKEIKKDNKTERIEKVWDKEYKMTILNTKDKGWKDFEYLDIKEIDKKKDKKKV